MTGTDESEARAAALESLWYEVLEAVQAGRTSGLLCPECQDERGLEIEEAQGRTMVTCNGCGRRVEVAIA
jgi:hypothetical protein